MSDDIKPRPITEIEEDFNSLLDSDFNPENENADGMERLYILTDELSLINDPDRIADILLACIERLSHSTTIDVSYDLGSPGPLVHTLEAIPGFEKRLIISLQRYPTPLTLWMLNRIINQESDPMLKKSFLQLIEKAIIHSEATVLARKTATEFLEYQRNKNR